MPNILNSEPQDLADSLAFAGLVLLAFELVRNMIVQPIKTFYSGIEFSAGPFESYEHDVTSRHKNEFEACLLYLRDFMQAIDAADMNSIQELRHHRNELAHNLAAKLPRLRIEDYAELFRATDRALFKLSNYRTYMEIGADPRFSELKVDWSAVKGHEYLLYEEVLGKLQTLQARLR